MDLVEFIPPTESEALKKMSYLGSSGGIDCSDVGEHCYGKGCPFKHYTEKGFLENEYVRVYKGNVSHSVEGKVDGPAGLCFNWLLWFGEEQKRKFDELRATSTSSKTPSGSPSPAQKSS